MRTLFIINRCKHTHLNYVRAVAPHCSGNRVVISHMANDWLGKTGLARADGVLGGVTLLHPEPVDELEIDLDRFDAAVRSALSTSSSPMSCTCFPTSMTTWWSGYHIGRSRSRAPSVDAPQL